MRQDFFDSVASASGVDLFQNAMDVVFNSVFRQIQVRGNFFVGPTFGNQSRQQLLPHRQERSSQH